jgi:signal transduction histidine kinase
MDVALAAVLCAVTLTTSVPDARKHSLTLGGAVVLAATAAYGAVLCRRRWPLAALAASVAAAAVFMTLSRAHGLVVIAPMIALYHLAAITSDRRRLLVAGALAALALAGLPELAAHVSGSDGSWLDGAKLAVTAACGLALAAGDATRSRRAYLTEVEDRARRAEHDRDQEARRRVTEERLRIARDLHDSMGHHIALISAQAGMAAHVFDDQPATARQALAHIRQASRQALYDLRDTIGLLRQPGEPVAPTKPTVGACGLDDLLASFRASGMRIDHQVDGATRPLPPAADLTAYRVVQEALTNAGKHAAGATTRVRLSFQRAALHIVVEDNGNGQPAHHADAASGPGRDGHGIVGMRERVAALGGTLDAGSQPGGGFRVSAVLPLPEGDRP